MKKICISFIVLFLVGGMLLFGCSNSATQTNNAVDSSVASETQQKQTIKGNKGDGVKNCNISDTL